jgi:hypothetical protein
MGWITKVDPPIENTGYRCEGGKHKMTDELVAEGKESFYTVRDSIKDNPIWDGPTSPSEYYGNTPHMPLVRKVS